MKKYLWISLYFIILSGCSTSKNPLIKVAKNNKSNYGKKYSYVIEERKQFSSLHSSPFSKKHIMYFYIYTDNIRGKVNGDEILWGIGNARPKALSSNSTFVFNSDTITITKLENCDSNGMCFFSDLNGKHKVVPISELKDINTNIKNVYFDFVYK